jgi:hypothetical protein
MAVDVNTDEGFAARMREAEAEAGIPDDSQLYGSSFAHAPDPEPEPEAEPVAAEPSESDLIAGLGIDEQAVIQFLDANPHLAGLFEQPTDDAGVERNAMLAASLMQGQAAQAGLADVNAQDAVEAAYQAIYDGDEQQAAQAVAALAGAVGVEDFGQVVQAWNEHDPEASGRWLANAQSVLYSAQAEQQAGAYQEQVQQAEQAQAEHWQKLNTVLEEFSAANPDMAERRGEIAQLAIESDIDPALLLDPQALPRTLGMLHEAARQADPDTPGTPAWEAAERARMFNTNDTLRGILRNEHTKQNFISRLPEGLAWDETTSRVVVAPVFDTDAIEARTKPTRALTQTEWEKQETDRIFGPDKTRQESHRAEVAAVVKGGKPGDRRTDRLHGQGRDPKTGQFVAATDKDGADASAEPAEQKAVAAAPARPARLTEWDAYPPPAKHPGAWWA